MRMYLDRHIVDNLLSDKYLQGNTGCLRTYLEGHPEYRKVVRFIFDNFGVERKKDETKLMDMDNTKMVEMFSMIFANEKGLQRMLGYHHQANWTIGLEVTLEEMIQLILCASIGDFEIARNIFVNSYIFEKAVMAPVLGK